MLNANSPQLKGDRSRRLIDEARFESLILRAEQGRLDFDGLRELARLYRVVTARLSELKTRTTDRELIRYLNGLCLRAYAHLQVPPARAAAKGGFWLSELPGALGRTARLQLIAAGLIAAGALLGARLASEDPHNLSATVPSGMYPAAALERLSTSERARHDFLKRRAPKPGMNTIFAGSLFAHNTRIGLLSLATGVLAAIPTTVLLVYNGLTLGGFASIFLRPDTALRFLLWLVPHAIPELLAIILCSSGGLALGLAVLSPGRFGRARALRQAGFDALSLLMAAVPLFVVAAFIESFVRESLLSGTARAAVALFALASLLGYLIALQWYARRLRRVDVGFLAAGITRAPLRGSPGSDRAAAR